MRKSAVVLLLAALIISLASCSSNEKNEEEKMSGEYIQITQEEAKRLMENEKDFVILDVREQDEYDEGHIKDALLLPYTKVDELAEEMLPSKDQMILVYCRSGRRSKIAAQSLADLGYTNVREFGGIIDWPYEITK